MPPAPVPPEANHFPKAGELLKPVLSMAGYKKDIGTCHGGAHDLTRHKCDFCNCEAEHTTYTPDQSKLEYVDVCEYHYWKLRPEVHGHNLSGFWSDYRYMHPVRVARWRKLYPEFDAMMRDVPRRGPFG